MEQIWQIWNVLCLFVVPSSWTHLVTHWHTNGTLRDYVLNSRQHKYHSANAKQFHSYVDMDGMTDREKDIIAVVWNDLALRKKLETDPYSLSKSDLKLLELNDEFNKRFVEINDEIQISTRRQAFKAYLQ